jgi:hypothetical protein
MASVGLCGVTPLRRRLTAPGSFPSELEASNDFCSR